MSNTYFRFNKQTIRDSVLEGKEINNMSLSLTVFIGNKETGGLQLTVYNQSNIPNQSGCGYITLTMEEIDLLIAGLLEHKLHKVSATGFEESNYCPEI